jgi:hypothetical protein
MIRTGSAAGKYPLNSSSLTSGYCRCQSKQAEPALCQLTVISHSLLGQISPHMESMHWQVVSTHFVGAQSKFAIAPFLSVTSTVQMLARYTLQARGM